MICDGIAGNDVAGEWNGNEADFPELILLLTALRFRRSWHGRSSRVGLGKSPWFESPSARQFLRACFAGERNQLLQIGRIVHVDSNPWQMENDASFACRLRRRVVRL